MSSVTNGGSGNCYYVESPGGGGQSYFESFPIQPTASEATVSESTYNTSSAIFIPVADTFSQHHHTTAQHHITQHQSADCYDQVVPNQHAEAVSTCAGEVEVSTTLVQYEDDGQPPILMEVPISNGAAGSVATVSIDPKGLNRGCSNIGLNRGCSKVVVETVKSIPMDAGGCVTATTTEANANYELMTHDMNGMKEIDFAMF